MSHLEVTFMRLLLLIGVMCIAGRADTLRLREGRTLSGQFWGATRAEIWFQRDVPGEVLGKEAFPVMQVESLTFGPGAQAGKFSAPPDAHFKNPLMFENCALSSSFSGSSSASSFRAALLNRSCTSGRSNRL